MYGNPAEDIFLKKVSRRYVPLKQGHKLRGTKKRRHEI